MKRCGINPSEYFNEEDFATILSFNNEEIFTRLGVAKSEISEMAIKEIYDTIKKLRINEIEKIRTFDKEKGYKQFSITINETLENNQEYALKVALVTDKGNKIYYYAPAKPQDFH